MAGKGNNIPNFDSIKQENIYGLSIGHREILLHCWDISGSVLKMLFNAL
jgi:hypothetical protein